MFSIHLKISKIRNPMLPIEVILHIVRMLRLKDRATFAVLSRQYFPFDNVDWNSFSRHYLLEEPTKNCLQIMLKRNYTQQIAISLRLNRLWSNHFNRPLTCWSPWTIRKCCYKTGSRAIMFFRQYRFVNYIRDLVQKHQLKTKHIKFVGHAECIKCTINLLKTKRLEMDIFKNKRKRKRFCIKTSLKFYERSRALLEFCVLNGYLWLKVRKLQFED